MKTTFKSEKLNNSMLVMVFYGSHHGENCKCQHFDIF